MTTGRINQVTKWHRMIHDCTPLFPYYAQPEARIRSQQSAQITSAKMEQTDLPLYRPVNHGPRTIHGPRETQQAYETKDAEFSPDSCNSGPRHVSSLRDERTERSTGGCKRKSRWAISTLEA